MGRRCWTPSSRSADVALKVYRTPIGFHDAYVAAPSQKAALAAWGADANLFARGVAEVVTDPALTAEPLARPGEVVKRLRGSAAEQLAAAPPVRRKQAAEAEPEPSKPRRAVKSVTTPKPAPPPRPSHDEVEAAEASLAQADARHRDAERALAQEEAALAERRRALRVDGQAERDRLEQARDDAERRYATALRKWQAE